MDVGEAQKAPGVKWGKVVLSKSLRISGFPHSPPPLVTSPRPSYCSGRRWTRTRLKWGAGVSSLPGAALRFRKLVIPAEQVSLALPAQAEPAIFQRIVGWGLSDATLLVDATLPVEYICSDD